jgi:hypothetical protein
VIIDQRVRTRDGWTAARGARLDQAQLALVFGSIAQVQDPATWTELAGLYPGARLVGCSTAGELADVDLYDHALVATAMRLEHGTIEVAAVQLGEAADSAGLGALLASRLPAAGLVHVLVISEGLKVNGSALVVGLRSVLPAAVGLSGGLSGDGAAFERTAVCLDGPTPTEQIVAIGWYGARLQIGCGSRGGWEPFGPERLVTRSSGTVLYELDGEPALDLYQRYLGEHAAGLPASGLSFPLAIRGDSGEPVVRTILAIDPVARSLTFAGDVPTGHRARLMRTNVTGLVDGAERAATTSRADQASPDLAILISCVGRKLVMKQRTEEELEAVRGALGERTALAGFYSYGEIAPFSATAPCELHNQTMTVTSISER